LRSNIDLVGQCKEETTAYQQ